MFKNCGEKIQEISVIVLIVGLIATVILAILFGKDNWGDFHLPRFIAILAGGGFSVYVGALFLNGFGKIVEYNEAQMEKLEQPQEVPEADLEKIEKKILNEGGWKCVCGRVNGQYVSSCACGKSRREGDVKSQ